MGILPRTTQPQKHTFKSKKVKERLYVSILSLSVCHICHVL